MIVLLFAPSVLPISADVKTNVRFVYNDRMPKVSQQHRDARREQILAAARRCFLRDGFHATSMQDLFAEAGLSAGAVYSYFASKDDVIVAIAEENMQGVTDMIHAITVQQPGRPVGAVLADVMDTLRAKETQDGIGKLTVIVWSEALRNPSLAARFTGLISQLRASLADVIQQNQGGLPGDVPAGVLAAALLSLVPGYLLQLALLGPDAVDGVPDAVRALWPGPESR
jgi:TetR/AcrR family transcriptional regulator, transcriptional repressor of aconitase